ncbi:unnamed protein product [Ostreobium quekettii]|uniref:MPN domain-containing protein n=1 Tax=Ostreobium quekettii TaxID=121088 RepID=A0A8S1JDX1_9CHLO|nr:unnamed protein product [Ostreobium quekettii]|eukprot:evm.model.scf_1001EXC.2 EVM.evm.TU.scf_1001EXC.2   scf_1001EXC:5206-9826(-)
MPSPERVVLHPLVLLSVVDHYNRVAKDSRKRVVGVLLGSFHRGVIDITNSFAVPFEEDAKDPSIWFLDHSYLENIFRMFKKVNAREAVVGWYSTGPRIREADLDINDLISRFCDNPVLVICEVQPNEIGLPITAYYAKEEVKEDGTEKSKKVFVNIPTQVGQTEAEEIGVEHLLRDVKDATISTLATDVSAKVQGVRGLSSRLQEIRQYLEYTLDGKMPVNHEIMKQLQDIFNLLPNMNVDMLSNSLAVKSNDMMLGVYVASLIRCVIALHNLIDNKEVRLGKKQVEKPKEKVDDAKSEKPADSKGEDKASGSTK